MERVLASIQKVNAISPIEGADKIEVATVLGWECVVPKDQFKVGDLVVYFEIDSMIPYTEWSKFLWKGKEPATADEKYRLRTIKLKGQISQGLVQPVSIYDGKAKEDKDVTDKLGVTKYEPPLSVNLRGNVKKQTAKWYKKILYKYLPFLVKNKPTTVGFPSFLHKTDEIRVQSIPKIFEEIAGLQFYTSEKVDGTSVTFYLKGKDFGVCSRNLELNETKDNTYWQVAHEYTIKDILSRHGNFAIQGEIIGEGIQKNRLNIKGRQLRIYNLFNIDTKKYVDFWDLKDFIDKNNLLMVPVVEYNLLARTDWDIKTLVDMADGNSLINPNALREGLVFRPMIENKSRVLKGRMSFKAISNAYLLKHGI